MYTGRLSRAKVTSARSMKFTTCASWAPGVSVAGKICEDMASMSAACASVKNANGTGCAEVAARWAYASASRMAGQCVASQTEPSPATESARKSLRDLLLAMIAPFNQSMLRSRQPDIDVRPTADQAKKTVKLRGVER